jgi:hypothetical protein
MNFPLVIAGLDPAIHPAKPRKILVLMDARVKPAHDGVRVVASCYLPTKSGRSRDDQA